MSESFAKFTLLGCSTPLKPLDDFISSQTSSLAVLYIAIRVGGTERPRHLRLGPYGTKVEM